VLLLLFCFDFLRRRQRMAVIRPMKARKTGTPTAIPTIAPVDRLVPLAGAEVFVGVDVAVPSPRVRTVVMAAV